MAELRYNPLLRDWTMVASNRQNRPNMPKDYCPFCPGSGKVPDNYDVYQYDNDFPALSPNPPQPDDVATDLYAVAEAYGKCEVVLYSPEHNTTLPQLPVSHIRKLVDLWTERFEVLSQDPKHKYILIFENRGPEVGVTMPHPHGQIYAYPYIPQKIRVELDSSSAHHHETGRCLICDINQDEASFQGRMLIETDHFVSYIPFFTDYPYGAFISSKAHKSNLLQFTSEERDDLAKILKLVTAGMDALFDREFPYMMALYQSPVNQAPTNDVIANQAAVATTAVTGAATQATGAATAGTAATQATGAATAGTAATQAMGAATAGTAATQAMGAATAGTAATQAMGAATQASATTATGAAAAGTDPSTATGKGQPALGIAIDSDIDPDVYYHFHIEFYPPLRAKDRIKYLASSETAAWAPCNPLSVEDTAVQLREAILKRKVELGIE
ncbi:galactose-1-phosphate uridylyltransferase [Alicyclobacillus ferrooxydans]|uniref:galactose-1-phosphate uridylyltransferase n=1 Tax=Alicyclobacillus ferrooxydans TaxID=471514 RepID=UPI0009FA989E|nr:galactose-1-phosphate uridylyltransferase [Alicyclobacillus ferrooxydans]